MRHRSAKAYPCEMLGAAEFIGFDQYLPPCANLRLEMTPGAGARLAQLGHDPKLGARPLRRTIEDLVVVPIAERMARDPAWREVTIRVTAAPEPGDITV